MTYTLSRSQGTMNSPWRGPYGHARVGEGGTHLPRDGSGCLSLFHDDADTLFEFCEPDFQEQQHRHAPAASVGQEGIVSLAAARALHGGDASGAQRGNTAWQPGAELFAPRSCTHVGAPALRQTGGAWSVPIDTFYGTSTTGGAGWNIADTGLGAGSQQRDKSPDVDSRHGPTWGLSSASEAAGGFHFTRRPGTHQVAGDSQPQTQTQPPLSLNLRNWRPPSAHLPTAFPTTERYAQRTFPGLAASHQYPATPSGRVAPEATPGWPLRSDDDALMTRWQEQQHRFHLGSLEDGGLGQRPAFEADQLPPLSVPWLGGAHSAPLLAVAMPVSRTRDLLPPRSDSFSEGEFLSTALPADPLDAGAIRRSISFSFPGDTAPVLDFANTAAECLVSGPLPLSMYPEPQFSFPLEDPTTSALYEAAGSVTAGCRGAGRPQLSQAFSAADFSMLRAAPHFPGGEGPVASASASACAASPKAARPASRMLLPPSASGGGKSELEALIWAIDAVPVSPKALVSHGITVRLTPPEKRAHPWAFRLQNCEDLHSLALRRSLLQPAPGDARGVCEDPGILMGRPAKAGRRRAAAA